MFIYYYIYFVLYNLTKRTNKEVVEWTSMIFLSVLIFLNIFCLLFMPNSTFFKKIETSNAKLLSMIVMAVIILINYYIFIFKERFRNIINKFSEQKGSKRIIGHSLVIIYVCLTFYFFFKII